MNKKAIKNSVTSVSAQNSSINDLENGVREAVSTVKSLIESHAEGRSTESTDMLCSIYVLSWHLHKQRNSLDDFIKRNGIQCRSDAKRNPAYPVCKWSFEESGQTLKSRTSKVAQILGTAIEKNIEPEAFSDWFQKFGSIEAAYNAVRNTSDDSKKTPFSDRAAERVKDKLGPDITGDFSGLIDAVKARGCVTILAVMPDGVVGYLEIEEASAYRILDGRRNDILPYNNLIDPDLTNIVPK